VHELYIQQKGTYAYLQTYYVTVAAVTLAGSVTVTSDGIMVVQEDALLPGIVINDGDHCDMTGYF
jgi:hypothetical protein